MNFYKDNLNITRETGYIISNKESKTKKQGQVRNFTDFKNIVLSNLGFNDLSYCEIYIIQPDILNTLYVDQKRMKDKTNLRVFLHVIINFLADKFSNTDRKPSIFFYTDKRYEKHNNGNIAKKLFERDFTKNYENIANVKLQSIDWNKKSSREQRFIYSSNYHGFSFNRGFDFFIEGKYGTKERDTQIYADSEVRNQLKVEKKVSVFYENTGKNYINLILSSFLGAKS